MASYIVLLNYTDQGIRNVKQSPKRRKAAIAAAEKLGIKVKEAYLTMGPCDTVILADAPDDEAMTSWAMSVGSLGNVRTQTMRAYPSSGMDGIISKLRSNEARLDTLPSLLAGFGGIYIAQVRKPAKMSRR